MGERGGRGCVPGVPVLVTEGDVRMSLDSLKFIGDVLVNKERNKLID